MKFVVNFNKGYIVTNNLKIKKLFIDEKGIYFKKIFKKQYIDAENSKVVY